MTEMKSFLIQSALRSSLPLLLGGTYHLLKACFLPESSHSNYLHSFDDGKYVVSEEAQENTGGGPPFLTILDQVSFGIYSNFSAFLLVMLLIEVCLEIAQQGFQRFWKEVSCSRLRLRDQNDYVAMSFEKEPIRLFYILSENHIMRILFYVLFFVMIQISGSCLSFAQSGTYSPVVTESSQDASKFSNTLMMNISQEEDYLMRIPRILKQEGNFDDDRVSALSFLSSEKFSLSMGTVLGLLNIDINDMILSKDKKTAFVTLEVLGTLNIIDISDLHAPTIKSTLSLQAPSTNFRVKSLALSSDEKTLYATSCKDLEIIDVTDLGSPRVICTKNSEIFSGYVEQTDNARLLKPSLVFDEDRELVYVGGMGLQIYNISNPKNPVLLKALKNDQIRENVFSRNELCLSHDKRVLFIANGTLDAYDVSDPKNMKLLHSLRTESSSRSILLSEDGKAAFLVGIDSDKEIIFEEVDISNPKDSISVRRTTKLGEKSAKSPHFLGIYPSKTKFFILTDSLSILTFDSIKQKTTMNEKGLIEGARAMQFLPDGKNLIAASSNGQFVAIELFFNYPNSQIFSETLDNLKANISFPTKIVSFQISKDEQFLFVVRDGEHSLTTTHFFEIWDLKVSKVLSSYKSNTPISQMHLAKNSNAVFLLSSEAFIELDVSNRSSINVKGIYKEDYLKDFIMSSDEKTAFILKFTDSVGCIMFLNLEDFQEIHTMSMKSFTQRMVLKDDKTLIVLDERMLIYDVSNLYSPTEIVSLSLITNEPALYINSAVVSADGKTLYIETFDENGFRKLRIYDISDAKSPQLISENFLTRFERMKILNRKGLFTLSPDQKTGFVAQADALIKLNLTDLKQPKIVGTIPLPYENGYEVQKFIFSPDRETIYAAFKNQIRVLDMNIKYTLYINKEKFLLGEKYSDKVLMLNRTSEESDYNLMKSDGYKIIKMSLLDMKVAPNKFLLDVTSSSLPSWMAFDSERDILSIEPKRLRDIGTYTLHSAFSLKVPASTLNESLGTVEKPVYSEDLIAWLISLDYLDSELFLTAKFKSLDTFHLPFHLSAYKEKIYNILRKYYVETCTLFEIVSSLELSDKNLKASTLSTNEIKAEIKLEPAEGTEAKFVNVMYGGLLPVIRENKTKAVLEGTISEINTALEAIVVNFENGTSCNASLLINDGFNPSVSVELVDISRYFRANNQPKLNHNTEKTLQEQIDSADIQTGKYFAFTLADDIFKDDYAESLTYELVMNKNDTGFPNWLSLSGFTLKGTPPEEILGRDMDLILIAKNEFKQHEVSFKLHIKMSTAFWLKLLLRYSPYILTVIGLFVSANKIFNIFAKRQYKHTKEYYLGSGKEISPEVIQPILFIREELKQSAIILKFMKKSWTDFIENSNGVLNKQMILMEIKEIIQRMPFKERERITRYPSQVIDTIIINKFVQMQLASDKKGKELFEQVRPKCLEIVEGDAQSSGFVINQGKLKRLLALSDDENTSSNNDLEESLIPGVNLELLKDAILAYAFEEHSIDVSPVDVDIVVKQQVQSRFLFRFLKLNLKNIYFNEKNKIDYGINYRIIDDKLLFYGVTQSYFQSKTLAVQIKNMRHKIMKEIWIHGASNNFGGGGVDMRESRSQQQEYEIF